MSKLIKVGLCMSNTKECRHFVEFESHTVMMNGKEIYKNLDIYNNLSEQLKDHFYKKSDDYIEKINKEKEEFCQKIIDMKEENIKELKVEKRCVSSYPCKHSIKIVDINNNIYEDNLLAKDIYNIQVIYDSLKPGLRKHIDKMLSTEKNAKY